PAGEAEAVSAEHESRRGGAVDLLQGDDVGIEPLRVARERLEVDRRALEAMRDVAGQSPLVAADRRVTRRAGVLERPELFRRDQPLEVPGGELEGGRGAGALGGVSRCERAEKREDSGPEGAQDVAAE